MVDYPSFFVISQLEHLLLLCEENYIATLLLSNLGEGAKYDQVTWVDEREVSGQMEVLGGTLLPLTMHWSECLPPIGHVTQLGQGTFSFLWYRVQWLAVGGKETFLANLILMSRWLSYCYHL